MCDVEEARQGLGFTLLIFPVGGMTVPPPLSSGEGYMGTQGESLPSRTSGHGQHSLHRGVAGGCVRGLLSFSILALLPTKQSIS